MPSHPEAARRPTKLKKRIKWRTMEEADANTERNLVESPLFRLPGEIRNKIYDYVFHADRIEASPCTITEDRGNSARIEFRTWTSNGDDILQKPLINLIRPSTTCRQLYAETAYLPYTNNTFVVSIYRMQESVGRIPLAIRKKIKMLILQTQAEWYHLPLFYRRNPDSISRPQLASIKDLPSLEKIKLMPNGDDDVLRRVHKTIKTSTGRDIEIVNADEDLYWLLGLQFD